MILFESSIDIYGNLDFLREYIDQYITNKIKYDYYLTTIHDLGNKNGNMWLNFGIILNDEYEKYDWVKLRFIKDNKYSMIYLKKLNTSQEFNKSSEYSKNLFYKLFWSFCTTNINDKKFVGSNNFGNISVNSCSGKKEDYFYSVFNIVLLDTKGKKNLKPEPGDKICKL